MSSLKDRMRSRARNYGMAYALGFSVGFWTIALACVWPQAVLWIAAGAAVVLAASWAAHEYIRQIPRP